MAYERIVFIVTWLDERRRRHGLQDTDECAFCAQQAETVDHLILGCVFARQLWHNLLSPIGLASLAPTEQENVADWWLRQRKRVDKGSRPVIDSMFLLVAWNLWKHRNSLVYHRFPSPDAATLRRDIVREADEWVQASYLTLSGTSHTLVALFASYVIVSVSLIQ